MIEVLILGPECSGKTLLCRRVKDLHADISDINIGLAATIGVDIMDINLEGQAIKVMELGSTISLRWYNYFPEATKLIFLVDLSDMSTWSDAMVLLHETMTKDTLSKPLLIVLNKSDSALPEDIQACYHYLQLDDLLVKNSLCKIFYGSLFADSFVAAIKQWISTSI